MPIHESISKITVVYWCCLYKVNKVQYLGWTRVGCPGSSLMSEKRRLNTRVGGDVFPCEKQKHTRRHKYHTPQQYCLLCYRTEEEQSGIFHQHLLIIASNFAAEQMNYHDGNQMHAHTHTHRQMKRRSRGRRECAVLDMVLLEP